jgi:hypothetical protein
MFSIFGAGDEVYRKYDYISKHVNRDEWYLSMLNFITPIIRVEFFVC